VDLRFAIYVAEQAAGLRVGHLSLSIDPHAAHERHVEHERAVSRGQAGDVVSASLDAEEEIAFTRELNTRDYVRDAEATRDQRRSVIDHRVPYPAALFVTLVARGQDWSAQH